MYQDPIEMMFFSNIYTLQESRTSHNRLSFDSIQCYRVHRTRWLVKSLMRRKRKREVKTHLERIEMHRLLLSSSGSKDAASHCYRYSHHLPHCTSWHWRKKRRRKRRKIVVATKIVFRVNLTKRMSNSLAKKIDSSIVFTFFRQVATSPQSSDEY